MSDFIPGGEPYDVTKDADYQPIEVRRNRIEVHKASGSQRVYNTATASRQWHIEPSEPNPVYFSGVALYQTIHGAWFAHYYHQWERFNSIKPLSRAKAIDLTVHYKPELVLPIFGPLPEAGERIRPRKKKP